jgi:hypothetical protein
MMMALVSLHCSEKIRKVQSEPTRTKIRQIRQNKEQLSPDFLKGG